MSKQNSCSDIGQSQTIPHSSINPVTNTTRELSQQKSESNCQISVKLNNISVDLPKQGKQVGEDKSVDGKQQSDIYKEHRQFLEKYKRERQRKRKESNARRQNLAKEEEEEQTKAEEQQSAFVQVVKQRMEEIHGKIKKQFFGVHQWDQERPRYKVFTEIIETKKDIARISKEKLFVRSQQQKHLEYSEPPMPLQSKVPQQFRIKSHSFQDELEMSRKAKQFVQRIHIEQQNLLGKQILRKRRQQFKKQRQEQREYKKNQQLHQIRKEERRLKAQQNLLLMKAKQRINHIINKQSLDQLKQLLEDKEKRLEDIRASLNYKENSKFREFRSKRGSMANQRQRIRTTMNDYSTYQLTQHNETMIHNDTLNKNQENKPSKKAFRAKLALKKLKIPRPTQYQTGEDEFLDDIIEKKLRKRRCQTRNLTQSIEEYPKQLSQKNAGGNQKYVSPYHMTEYDEGDTFGIVVPKNERVKTEN